MTYFCFLSPFCPLRSVLVPVLLSAQVERFSVSRMQNFNMIVKNIYFLALFSDILSRCHSQRWSAVNRERFSDCLLGGAAVHLFTGTRRYTVTLNRWCNFKSSRIYNVLSLCNIVNLATVCQTIYCFGLARHKERWGRGLFIQQLTTVFIERPLALPESAYNSLKIIKYKTWFCSFKVYDVQ